MTNEDRNPNQGDQGQERQPTVLPSPKGPPRAARKPEEPVPPFEPRKMGPKRSKLGVFAFTTILGAILVLGIVAVLKVDMPKTGMEEVPGGTLYRVDDGVVAIQESPAGDKKMYYLVEAHRVTEPRVVFRDSGATLRVTVDRELRSIIYQANWKEAPAVVLFTFRNQFSGVMILEGDTELIENFAAAGGDGGSVSRLLAHFHLPPPSTP